MKPHPDDELAGQTGMVMARQLTILFFGLLCASGENVSQLAPKS